MKGNEITVEEMRAKKLGPIPFKVKEDFYLCACLSNRICAVRGRPQTVVVNLLAGKVDIATYMKMHTRWTSIPSILNFCKFRKHCLKLFIWSPTGMQIRIVESYINRKIVFFSKEIYAQ